MEEKGYILNQEGLGQQGRRKMYRMEELGLMTTHQLREICRNEKIIQGIINPLDKEELIHTIMRYHGMREHLIIKETNKQGMEKLKDFFNRVTFQFQQNSKLQIASKIVVYKGLSLGFHDDISIPYQSELDGTNALIISGGAKICGLFYLSSLGNRKDKLTVGTRQRFHLISAPIKPL